MRIAEGAEFIHGDYAGHLLREFVIQHEWPLELKKWPNYYWFSGSNSFVLASDRPEVNEMMRLLAKTKLSDIPTGVDSLLEFLKTKHFSLTQINSIVPLVNDWGGELQMIGVRDMVEMFKNEIWDDEGETYSRLTHNMLSDVMEILAKGLKIKYQWPVVKVVDKKGYVEVYNKNRQLLKAKRVIITSSVNVLKSGVIEFIPPLPPKKIEVLKKVEMANLVKGHFLFDEPFWSKRFPDCWDICCVGPVLIPEVWMSSRNDRHLITCFLATTNTTVAGSYEEERLLQAMQEQLDRMFGTHEDLTPATNHLIKRQLVDWSRYPFVLGGYVCPSIGVVPGDKEVLAESFGNVYFAGEATHEKVDPCIQAAMETGLRAAKEVLSSLKESKL
eukprot:TRINITY_DN5179_c0_g1_i1.p1 TRINITY_DN5179_c0_g1~~TRINITY_DN5179_c0_g1_i1.p1  ORF type:complete len:386 (+),score=71.68 TRINITY_DN5179_c0_g1_i1:258-1415(+)